MVASRVNAHHRPAGPVRAVRCSALEPARCRPSPIRLVGLVSIELLRSSFAFSCFYGGVRNSVYGHGDEGAPSAHFSHLRDPLITVVTESQRRSICLRTWLMGPEYGAVNKGMRRCQHLIGMLEHEDARNMPSRSLAASAIAESSYCLSHPWEELRACGSCIASKVGTPHYRSKPTNSLGVSQH